MVWENIFTLKQNFIRNIFNLGEYIRIMIFLEGTCDMNDLWWKVKISQVWFLKRKDFKVYKLISTQRVDEVDGIMTQSEVPVQYLQGTRGEKCLRQWFLLKDPLECFV